MGQLYKEEQLMISTLSKQKTAMSQVPANGRGLPSSLAHTDEPSAS